MSKHIAFRVDEQRQAKLEHIMAAMGVNRTDALTALIDNASLVEVKTVRPVATLAVNSRSANNRDAAPTVDASTN